MTSDEQNFIEIKGVSKHFGDVVAVDNVDLAIKKGELFSILGRWAALGRYNSDSKRCKEFRECLFIT